MCNEMMVNMRKHRKRVDDETGSDDDSITSDGVCVYFYAEVSRANNLKLIKCLREATVSCLQHSTSPHSPPRIYLYIHSNGGDAYAGLAMYDHIRLNTVPIVTVADGMVASAASFMLLAANHRLMHENSFVRIHQLSIVGFEGTYAVMMDEMQNTHCLMKKLEDMYVARTGMSLEHCRNLLRQEIDMDADRCLTEGLVHEILRPGAFSYLSPTSASDPPKKKKRANGVGA
jgi:ATP-dependent protease ClpP protease subunit